MIDYKAVVSKFLIEGSIADIKPLGQGLINDTFKVTTAEPGAPDYVLQRINNAVFKDVELLQHNIEAVTRHLRQKQPGKTVLRFVETEEGKTYTTWPTTDGNTAETSYFRLSVFIPDTLTINEVNPTTSLAAGKAFGEFERLLTDLDEPLGETIPDFHNMTLRYRQLNEAVSADAVGRVGQVADLLRLVEEHAEEMCQAERLHAEGLLPKRICHCDTKVNNMLFDQTGHPLCVIDLDTVMPSFVFSDYGDFLRTAANTVAEDSPDIDRVAFRTDIYEAFTEGYLSEATFLTPLERAMLPFAARLFPFMQGVRFLADYINGDTYYKTSYPEHNLVRARNQFALFIDATKKLKK